MARSRGFFPGSLIAVSAAAPLHRPPEIHLFGCAVSAMGHRACGIFWLPYAAGWMDFGFHRRHPTGQPRYRHAEAN